jgi:hypothetical protein
LLVTVAAATLVQTKRNRHNTPVPFYLVVQFGRRRRPSSQCPETVQPLQEIPLRPVLRLELRDPPVPHSSVRTCSSALSRSARNDTRYSSVPSTRALTVLPAWMSESTGTVFELRNAALERALASERRERGFGDQLLERYRRASSPPVKNFRPEHDPQSDWRVVAQKRSNAPPYLAQFRTKLRHFPTVVTPIPLIYQTISISLLDVL